MDLDPDEIDIQLRSPIDVGRRMIALSAVSHCMIRASADPLDEDEDIDQEDSDSTDDEAGERFDWVTWMTQERLLDALSSFERDLLANVSIVDDPDALDDEGAAVESLGALAWAVGQSELTVLERGYPYLHLLDLVPSPWDGSSSFLSRLELRTEPEIASAREAVEVLSWRAQIEMERRRASGRDRTDIEAAIREVAAEVAAVGVATVGPDGDLTIGGESIRLLSDTLVTSMVAAARARLRAMNWLCGLGEWDDPALTEI